ncbi:tannase and feruloyl esterase [Hortaea werneckii]|nr:tannase and feruloyl esterase [Hortaea werneckii]KAI7023089.1 tannase and feruloyl esterase [Hortaea werneckii]KAI7186368.1 tannase and feruloyl esterase [Hortaea werneckii]KAI7583117.1 tannase and feruloyl esterase [Hortaea werneckii]KAI7674172.1 tannase and feruloyl esterase [Hortaea werneckii]
MHSIRDLPTILTISLCLALPISAVNCTASSIARPSVFGAEILNITASRIPAFGNIPGNDVCSFTVTITHPGTGDRVNNYISVPLQGWNGRFQGIGGGGYAAGTLSDAAPQTALGYSTGATDAGHDTSSAAVDDASPWALLSEGNVDQNLLLNFARRSLHDMTIIGKAISEEFYGKTVDFSYWNGCSTGGREGLAIAQYYPSDYDGIIANAPAIQWNDFTPAQQWPYTVQNNEGYAPSPSEFQAAVTAAIAACDGLDGFLDGIISAPALCDFTAQRLVGSDLTCSGAANCTFSQQAADVIDKIWQGPRTPEGEFLWYGLPKGANFSAFAPNLANSSEPQPFLISDSWFRGFLAKDLNFSTANISYTEFTDFFLQGHLQYDSIIGDASPDLRPFKEHGGKMITWQGLADQLIMPQGTQLYYEKIQKLDSSVHDFYRQFYSPGVGHCGGGIGVTPTHQLEQLRAWVENGTAPDLLQAGSAYPVNASSDLAVGSDNVRSQALCPYPEMLKGGMTSTRQAWAMTVALEGQAGMEVDMMVPHQGEAVTHGVRSIARMNESANIELQKDFYSPIQTAVPEERELKQVVTISDGCCPALIEEHRQ